MAQTSATRKPAAKSPAKRTPAAKPAAKRSPAAKPAARRSPAARTMSSRERPTATTRAKPAIDRTAKLSGEVLARVEKSQRVAIEAVRKFVDTVDQALPALPHGDGPSRRQEVVDSALEMADRLVHTQYDFIRQVIDDAAKSLSRSDDAK